MSPQKQKIGHDDDAALVLVKVMDVKPERVLEFDKRKNICSKWHAQWFCRKESRDFHELEMLTIVPLDAIVYLP